MKSKIQYCVDCELAKVAAFELGEVGFKLWVKNGLVYLVGCDKHVAMLVKAWRKVNG